MVINNREFEDRLLIEGKKLIAGVDEVGRGPIAGPVVVACVILPPHFFLEGLIDSKKVSAKKRDYLYDRILEGAIEVKYEFINEQLIDQVNIYQASKLAMQNAVNSCVIKPDYVLVDAMKLDIDIPTIGIIKGDEKSISIAAASIVAKVIRDRYMRDLAVLYPQYGFDKNKGYPTKYHKEALLKFGVLDIHRKTFSPVKELLNQQIKFDL
jgi:ribonuclease HII